MNREQDRLQEADHGTKPWRCWGPYLAERQWGTVREDYSADGTAWEHLPHDHARSRAYRWGEDGIAGISDEKQQLCLSLALWNGRDPILKERMFGLTGNEGNHGEDVKELYWYLDSTPTHSYMRMLYKYPQGEYPYARLVEENHRRGKDDPEFELLDSGVFNKNRYFDVEVEIAKASPDDLLYKITAHNRGPEAAEIHILPTLWFRNTWSFGLSTVKPKLEAQGNAIKAVHEDLGTRRLYCDGDPQLLFCDNETNHSRLEGTDGGAEFPKDAINDAVVSGRSEAVNPAETGTKAAAWYRLNVPAGESVEVRVRLSDTSLRKPFAKLDDTMTARHAEANAFYKELQTGIEGEDARRVHRQALAGMLWSKQFYYYDVEQWLEGDPGQPPPPADRRHGRNSDWGHLNNADIISMPDTWEYPWYAGWDLAFHCLPLALVDPEFAKQQLVLMTREWYMHPNGQLPAYEWAFSDVNPPVHAWATWRVFQIDRNRRGGHGDIAFLERVFHKLMINFTWWVNRKDPEGRNVFEGGFLGLDNIGVFDRSAPLPTGGHIHQSDGTSWMAMYSLNLMRIALELALHNPVYEDIASKFFEHFLHIAEAMSKLAGEGLGLWDEQDEFYYDVLHLPNDRREVLRVRSMVGLIPLFAVEVLEPELLERLPGFAKRLEWVLANKPHLAESVSRWCEPGRGERRLLSLLRGHRIKCLLRRMLDEGEFLSPHGVRALSRHHLDHPYTFWTNGQPHTVPYTPAESDTGLFGGNSNWRGPVWFPVNFLIVESLQRFHHYYGDDFTIECPTGSGDDATLIEVADELGKRLASLFLRDSDGRRPVFGDNEILQQDPHFRDHLHFYEYFDGDTGRGVGASHQTGWTGLVAKLLQPRRAPR
jgi:Mannosylglycerate hydrolase MGH1-like glycoside hydrolase domain